MCAPSPKRAPDQIRYGCRNKNGQFSSFYKAAKLYSVPETSLRHRVNSCILITQSNAKKRKL